MVSRLIPDLIAYAGPGTTSPGPAVAPLQGVTRFDTSTGGGPSSAFSVFGSFTVTGDTPGGTGQPATSPTIMPGRMLAATASAFTASTPQSMSGLAQAARTLQTGAASLGANDGAPCSFAVPSGQTIAGLSRALSSRPLPARPLRLPAPWIVNQADLETDQATAPDPGPTGPRVAAAAAPSLPVATLAAWDEALLGYVDGNEIRELAPAADSRLDPSIPDQQSIEPSLAPALTVGVAVALWSTWQVTSRPEDRRVRSPGLRGPAA